MKKAKRDRKGSPTRNKVFNELRRLKIKKYYKDAELKENLCKCHPKRGQTKTSKKLSVCGKREQIV